MELGNRLEINDSETVCPIVKYNVLCFNEEDTLIIKSQNAGKNLIYIYLFTARPSACIFKQIFMRIKNSIHLHIPTDPYYLFRTIM